MRNRFPRVAFLGGRCALLGCFLVVTASRLDAQSAARRDTTKATTKPATAKPATTTKPATTAKPAAAPTTKPSTGASTGSAGGSAAGAATAKPAPTGTRPTAPAVTGRGATTSPAAGASSRRVAGGMVRPFDEGGTALYGGVASPSLSFAAGPIAGLAWRRPIGWPALSLRADLAGSYHTQSPVVSGGEQSTLIHAGGSAGMEVMLRRGPGIRPYLGAAVGVYRFQANGPAGKAALRDGDIYASTTDVAGIATVGARFSSRFFVEARYLTVSDFTSIPLVLGVRF